MEFSDLPPEQPCQSVVVVAVLEFIADHDLPLEDPLRPEQRHSHALEHEPFRQHRARPDLTEDVNPRPQPLERRKAAPAGRAART